MSFDKGEGRSPSPKSSREESDWLLSFKLTGLEEEISS